jgi:hypothetical protein
VAVSSGRELTPAEVSREVSLIKDATNWPLGDRAYVKRWLGDRYECGLIFSACATSGSPVAVPTVYVNGNPLPPFDSVEAMVAAGWIGD